MAATRPVMTVWSNPSPISDLAVDVRLRFFLAQLYKEELAIAVATEGDTSCGSFLATS